MDSNKHSGFSTTFPIYLWHTYEDFVPVDEPAKEDDEEDDDDSDDDEAIIEDISKEEAKEPEMKTVTVEEWMHVNPMPPVWMRRVKSAKRNY